MIEPVAQQLDVPLSNIFANRIIFDEDGLYAGFDVDALTSRSGGKTEVISKLKNEQKYDNVVMVGDGVTDMEAKKEASIFIGYGGIVVRDPVRLGADWFITDMNELIKELL